MKDDDMIACKNCYNGRWEAECCNGAGGCSCEGKPVDMGVCLVCGGTGRHTRGADTRANSRSILSSGRCFIGGGPKTGYWAGK